MDEQIRRLVSQLNETFGPPFLPKGFWRLQATKQDDGSWMFNLYVGRRDIQLLFRDGKFVFIGQATEMKVLVPKRGISREMLCSIAEELEELLPSAAMLSRDEFRDALKACPPAMRAITWHCSRQNYLWRIS